MKSNPPRLRWLVAITAASLGLISLGVMAADNPGDTKNTDPSQRYIPLAFPNGFAQGDLTDAAAIKTGMVKITERAVTKGSFNSFLAELALQDRQRAREFKNPDQSKLDEQIDRIQQAWKAKYNEDFAISDKNLVFDDSYQIIQGKVSDPNAAIDNWPVSAPATGVPAAAADRSPNGGDVQQQITDAKLSKGRDVALVRFPAVAGTRELTVSMIFHYIDFWRVDVPNDRTGEKIYNDLLWHLKYLADNQARWPDDKLMAYRLVAHHAAAALYGMETNGALGLAQ